MGQYAAFNLVDSLLFFMLAIAAIGRSIRKYQADGRRFPVPRRSRSVHTVFLILALYGFARSAVLFCIGIGRVPNNEGFAQAMVNTIPATFLVGLEVALIHKWVSHAEELTLILRHERFRVGPVMVTSCIALAACYLLVTILAIADSHFHEVGLSPGDWTVLCDAFSGVVYTFNGLVFAGLGVRLWLLWDTPLESDREARLRVFGIALVFSIMSVTRGLILVLFVLQSSSKQVNETVSSGWGAPTVLLFELLCLITSLFLLAAQGSGGSAAGGNAANSVGGEVNTTLIGTAPSVSEPPLTGPFAYARAGGYYNYGSRGSFGAGSFGIGSNPTTPRSRGALGSPRAAGPAAAAAATSMRAMDPVEFEG